MKELKHVITIDFETYYDSEYSLAKMPTQAYVIDPRFEIIGAAVKVDTGETQWFDSHELTLGALYKLPWEESLCVAHNAQFDGLILEAAGMRYPYFGKHKPAKYFCTMMAAMPGFYNRLGSVSLAALSEYFKIGAKGEEVYNAKGKHYEDFSQTELAAYVEYCKNDVNLTYIIYLLLDEWFKARGQ